MKNEKLVNEVEKARMKLVSPAMEALWTPDELRRSGDGGPFVRHEHAFVSH
jgi:hypothetical protein